MNKLIISIDGKAGSGKERIAKYIANKYKFFHLDSGVLYRRFAYIILLKKIKFKDQKKLKKFIFSLNYLSARNHKNLRKESISKIASIIAKKQLVRDFINKQQKIIINHKLKLYKGCVIDGRDIGSKVFKNAKIKLYIEVKTDIRAKRRHKQLIGLGEKSIYSNILKEIQLRDKNDSERKSSPLVVPEGSILINNSDTFKKTISQINQALKKI